MPTRRTAAVFGAGLAALPWRLVLLAAGLSSIGLTAVKTVRAGAVSQLGSALIVAGFAVLAVALVAAIRRRTSGKRDSVGRLDALVLTCGIAVPSWAYLLSSRLSEVRGAGWPDFAYPVSAFCCLALVIRLLTAVIRPEAIGRIRLGLLGAASLLGPLALLSGTVDVRDRFAIAGLSALTFLLVLIRMAGVLASNRLALARERALRAAAAALVSAVDFEAVAAAVRTGVGQLLPADTPHGVVLAMAVSDTEPQSSAAMARADVDRVTGTVARLVATRDIDWVIGVRLTRFAMTLRCPMVLPDRRNGDPLIAVLHIGAPPEQLARLRHLVEVLAAQAALALERIELGREMVRRDSETYFRTLVQNTADVILIVDGLDRIRYASPSATEVLATDPTDARVYEVIESDDRDRLAEMLNAVRAGESVPPGTDLRALGANRPEVLLEVHCRDLRADKTVAGLVVTMRDVTERRQLERELKRQAFHDSMTGLANRVLYADRLQHALARGARDGSVVGVLFIDLDDFKGVNDTLGHSVGDQLLIAVAQRITGALRADDTAARLGGDEFAALIENVRDPGAVEEAAARILAALAPPVRIGAHEVRAGASIGITTTPEGHDADELLRQADLALYVAKSAGKNQWRRYQAHLHSAMVERLELRSALDHAVNQGHFVLQYQPIVELATDELVGFEALVRWSHPTQGVIAPAGFIEVAEESGLIVPIGRWVLDQALRTVAQWRRIMPRTRGPYVSVNVSARQLRGPGFVEQVRTALTYAQVPPAALMVEVSEALLGADHEAMWSELAILRELGVQIAIGDLGAGSPSLSALRQRPVDVVKIDKLAVDAIMTSPEQLAEVNRMVELADSLDLSVIAAGIESSMHRDLLLAMGCRFGQGYFYSSPVDGAEALSQLTSRQPLAA